MLDDIQSLSYLASKLKEKIDAIGVELSQKIDGELQNFNIQSQSTVDEYVKSLISEFNLESGKALQLSLEDIKKSFDESKEELLLSASQEISNKANEVLSSESQNLALESRTLLEFASEKLNQIIDQIQKAADAKIAEAIRTIKKGDKGDRGADGIGIDGKDGKDGKDGAGISKIEQTTTDTISIRLTNGSSYPITLPRGRSGGGGGIGQIQKFYDGADQFPEVGTSQILYFDTSVSPYSIAVWDGQQYQSVGGGSGGSCPDDITPYFIPDGDRFIVPINKPYRAFLDVKIDGWLKTDGFLVESNL